MGQTLTWGTPPPKCSHLKIFQLLVLAGLFHFCSGINWVTRTVKDRAVLSCGYNFSDDELTKVRIYWQKNDYISADKLRVHSYLQKISEMVLAVISGKVEVWPKYKDRTSIYITNDSSIAILDLRPSDSGMYTCVIQKLKEGGYERVHLTSVTLLVRADFPVPNIIELGNPFTNIKRIICSTSGGFPKPHLSWLENGKELKAINTTVSQDPESELYTISSELDFNVTNNHSFTCLVKYGNLTVSDTFNWQKSEDSSFQTSPTMTVLGVIVVLLLPCIGLVYICRRILKAARRNGESMEMERISSIFSGSAEASG